MQTDRPVGRRFLSLDYILVKKAQTGSDITLRPLRQPPDVMIRRTSRKRQKKQGKSQKETYAGQIPVCKKSSHQPVIRGGKVRPSLS